MVAALLPPRSNGKPEAATAVDELLMMGMRMPETCWALFKRQAINLRDWCIWLVDLFELHYYIRKKYISFICGDFWRGLYFTRTRWTSFACHNKYRNYILTVSTLTPRLPEFNDASLPLCFLLGIEKCIISVTDDIFKLRVYQVLLKLADCVGLIRLYVGL